MITFPKKVNIFEVGPRDGLQNEPTLLSLEKKFQYIEALIAAGFTDIEVGAFVREDFIPQMKDTAKIFELLQQKGYTKKKGLRFWALVPNEKGLERALQTNVRHIAVFTGSTETFTQKNIGMGIKDSLKVFEKVIARARKEGIQTRGYLSTVWGCPYEGKVKLAAPLGIAKSLLSLGVTQVSLGDTIGVATPVEVQNLLAKLKSEIKKDRIAGHFHDTRGTSLANCLISLQMGVKTLDSSSGGLGGCNYAPGASGNASSEDLIYMLHGMKIKTGVDLEKLTKASMIAMRELGRSSFSKYLQAQMAKEAK